MHKLTFCKCADLGLGATYPRRALEDIEDLLLCDRLVGGLRVCLGSWSKDGVDVSIN